MTTSSLALARGRTTWWTRAADYVELTKPKIGVLVLVTVGVSMFVASWGQPDPRLMLHTLLGVALVAASGSAINQWLERTTDARMPRTANRPLPAGRLSGTQVLTFAALTIVLGVTQLAVAVNLASAGFAVLSWVIYAWVYTPLKRISSLNTAVGAVSGALPILIGWSAAGGELGLRAASLFTVLFLWQFPHFMAIAWMYREQYGRAGLQMLTVVDSTGRRAGVQAVSSALALLPVSFIPGLFAPPPAGSLFAAFAFLLGVGQLICAVLFFALRSDAAARLLLRASLVYLPAFLLLLMFLPLL